VDSVSPLLVQPSMNVFRRFAGDRTKMIDFYGKVLGLKPLPPINMPGGGQMIRFQVGTSEIKLQATPAASQYKTGSVREVVGLRVLTFFFPDEAALVARFKESGHKVPEFRPTNMGRKVAMVHDPEKQWVELVIAPGAPSATFDRIEVGLTVSDLDSSRAFYRSFVGLEELKPMDDPLLGVTKYPFRHGTTTINVWSFGNGLPVNTRSAGIQYIVHDVAAIDALAKARHVTIDQPLGNFSSTLRTIWLADPDGITNYFAEIVKPSPPSQPPG
jgi:catechol 2,3-dioxygenase-like lactoylglutathione lyase family enzyme